MHTHKHFTYFFKLLITEITNSCLFAPLSNAELINQKCHEIAIVPLTEPNLRNIWGRFLLFLSKPEHLLMKSIHLLLFQFNEHLSLYHKITQWTLTSVTQSTKLKQLIGDVKHPGKWPQIQTAQLKQLNVCHLCRLLSAVSASLSSCLWTSWEQFWGGICLASPTFPAELMLCRGRSLRRNGRCGLTWTVAVVFALVTDVGSDNG